MHETKQFLDILTTLEEILRKSENLGQALVIQNLKKCLEQNPHEFRKLINSIDMWGGSGAVWEVGIGNVQLAKSFEECIISLINLMEDADMIDRKYGIKRVRTLFIENLARDDNERI